MNESFAKPILCAKSEARSFKPQGTARINFVFRGKCRRLFMPEIERRIFACIRRGKKIAPPNIVRPAPGVRMRSCRLKDVFPCAAPHCLRCFAYYLAATYGVERNRSQGKNCTVKGTAARIRRVAGIVNSANSQRKAVHKSDALPDNGSRRWLSHAVIAAKR